MPLVSIIIPTFNCESYIAATINSVLSQSHKDIEIIVVDDGSSDKTKDIVREFNTKVKLISQPNSGVCVARNRGLSESSGSFICFMDHDDYWYPEKLASQVEIFRVHPEVGVVYSRFINWYADTNGQFPSPESFEPRTIQDEIDTEFSGWVYHLFLLDSWMLTSTAIFRSDVLKKCGGFDESLPFSEDWDLWLRVTREYPMIRMTRPTTLYRQHQQQGNRLVRDIDYRTRLLTQAVKKWGLCSKDGRCITKSQFFGQLAIYHTIFGLNHLRGGKFGIAISSFFKAWLCTPLNLKYLAYIPAAMLGWKPK